MHYLAFDKNWFLKHQSKLIWLLNHKLTKRLFRWILCIDNEETINRIEPNAYWFGAKKKGKQIEVKADFRTHNKYSKRLYFAFSPLWWTMHFLDWLFIDKYIPKLSFGFLTLTAYPDADPETTTVDGGFQTDASNATWATVHDATTGTATDNGAFINAAGFLCGTTSNRFTHIYRSMFLFDTSSLTSSATISSTVFSLWNRFKQDDGGRTPSINVYDATPASNTALVNGDYDNFGTTALATAISYASWDNTDTIYGDFTLNATGIAAVSKTGVTKLGVRDATYDVPNSAPTWGSEQSSRFGTRSADTAGTTQDPKLVVTYTIASAKHFALLGVG